MWVYIIEKDYISKNEISFCLSWNTRCLTDNFEIGISIYDREGIILKKYSDFLNIIIRIQ